MKTTFVLAALVAFSSLAGCPQAADTTTTARPAPDRSASQIPPGEYRGELRYVATYRISGQPLSSNTEREARVLNVSPAGVPLRPDSGEPENVGATAEAQSTGFRITETTRAIRVAAAVVTIDYDVVIAYEQLPGTNEPFALRGLQTITYTLLEDGSVLMDLRLNAVTDLLGEPDAITLSFVGDGVLRRSN